MISIIRNEEGGWFIRGHEDLGIFPTREAAQERFDLILLAEQRAEEDAATARSGEEPPESYILYS